MQAIQVTPLRRILLPTPPSALLSSHLLYSSLLVVGFNSKQLQDRNRGCGVVYSKAFSSSRCTFELTVKVILSESYFQEIFVLQLTSSALKKEKKYKYSYNLVYHSPFLTIDFDTGFIRPIVKGLKQGMVVKQMMTRAGKGRTEDDTRWQRGDIRQKICLDKCHFQGVEKVNGLSISLYRGIQRFLLS